MTLPPGQFTSLTFGMVPTQDTAELRVVLNRFCEALGRSIGRPVAAHRAPSPRALASAMHAGRVQLAWISPTLMVMSDHVRDVFPLVSTVRQGVTRYHALLFVRDESRILSVEQLQGTRVAWVAPTSAAGYLLPRISLARKGVDLSRVFAKETFYQSHPAVARAVFDGEADVGATHGIFEGSNPQRALVSSGFSDASRAPGQRPPRILDVSGPIPSDVIVAAKSVPIAARVAVANALTKLSRDETAAAAIKKLFSADDFLAFSTDARADLQAIVEAGRTLGVLSRDAEPG